MRFIPLAMNHFEFRDSHFNATLREFETQLVRRLNGCSLMSSPFALSLSEWCSHEDPILMGISTDIKCLAPTYNPNFEWLGLLFANASFLSAYDQDLAGGDQNLSLIQSLAGPSHEGDIRQSLNEGGGHIPGLNPEWHQN